MASQLLGQIANPQMADIAGALDYRQKKMQEDEARRKEIKFQQIAGKALSTGLKEGSVLHELAMNDPARYLMVSKALGVDPANGAEGMSMMDDISSIYGHTVQGTENGLGYVQSLIKTRGELGLDTKRLQDLYDQGVENPTVFKNTIDLMQKTFNPDKQGSNIGTYNPRDYTTDSWAEFTKTGDPSGLKRYESSQIVDIGGVKTLVDKTTGERTAVTSLDEVAGNTSAIKGAGKSAEENAKDMQKYKTSLFDSINANSRMLNKYRFAIKQIDDGAETGPIINRLPNLKEQSILVDVVRKEIGMEILGSGLLGVNPTDKDVEFALTTAIPDNLRPDALKRELERRSQILDDLNAAQEEYYRLVDEEGYSKGDILKLAREKRQGGSDQVSMTTGATGSTEKKETAAERFARLKGAN
ncbi:hypothetical protein [Polynucleobacter sp.]|uniref:hypothetical protein n=1 Tax=Polynucleobacter sp. TaxID=2029855 RepID=UPI003F69DE2A